MVVLLQIVVPLLDFLVGALGKEVGYLDKSQLVDIQAVVEGILLKDFEFYDKKIIQERKY